MRTFVRADSKLRIAEVYANSGVLQSVANVVFPVAIVLHDWLISP